MEILWWLVLPLPQPLPSAAVVQWGFYLHVHRIFHFFVCFLCLLSEKNNTIQILYLKMMIPGRKAPWFRREAPVQYSWSAERLPRRRRVLLTAAGGFSFGRGRIFCSPKARFLSGRKAPSFRRKAPVRYRLSAEGREDIAWCRRVFSSTWDLAPRRPKAGGVLRTFHGSRKFAARPNFFQGGSTPLQKKIQSIFFPPYIWKLKNKWKTIIDPIFFNEVCPLQKKF